MLNFKNKYLKYKIKYLQLKNIQTGGDLPIINDVYSINLFTDIEMEKYMNPIYGYILTRNELLSNLWKINYYCGDTLNISDAQKTYFGIENIKHIEYILNIVNKVCRRIPGTIQPTLELMKKEPIDYGRYIGLKYINNKLLKDKKLISFNLDKQNKIVINEKIIVNEGIKQRLIGYIDDIRKYIPFLDDDKFSYHIILFCMFWVANNDGGIIQYYEGIKEVFELIRTNFKKDFVPDSPISIELTRIENPNSFENYLLNNSKGKYPEFKLYNQEWAKHFCVSYRNQNYPDCGEITALNLINLIIYNKEIFDITKLGESAIPQLREFYRVFNQFDKISYKDNEEDIFGKKLNARNAWSYLIINYANSNIIFTKKCDEPLQSYEFEMNSGLSKDNITPNFLQLIKNLLGIQNWQDLKKDNILSIIDQTDNGIGSIIITNKIFGEFEINCSRGHYYMKNINNISYSNMYRIPETFTPEQTNEIKIIKKNNIYIDIDLQNLENVLKYKIEYLILRTMNDNLYYQDSILIYALGVDYNNIHFKFEFDIDNKVTKDFIYKNYIETKKITNDVIKIHNIKSQDYTFFENMPSLFNKIIIKPSVKNIDLSPLKCIQTIKNSFLSGLINIKEIDLSPLSNVIEIGEDFLSGCVKLENINLSPLNKIKNIKRYFLWGCKSLTEVDLSPLINIESVGSDFLHCESITSIDLRPLYKIKIIQDAFLYGCYSMQQIDLSPLLNIESVGSNFLRNCVKITNVDLKPLSKIDTIQNNFIYGCTLMNQIDLSPLINIKSIGDGFLNQTAITNIDLSPFNKINKINNLFLAQCTYLKELDFSTFIEVNEIMDDFLNNCLNLEKINLSGLKNVRKIGKKFINNCSSLKEIDLSFFSNVVKIDDDFLNNCSNLTEINFCSLTNVTEIGTNFLKGCSSIISYDLTPLIKLSSIGNNILNLQRNFSLQKIFLTYKQRNLIKTTNYKGFVMTN